MTVQESAKHLKTECLDLKAKSTKLIYMDICRISQRRHRVRGDICLAEWGPVEGHVKSENGCKLSDSDFQAKFI